MKFQQEIKNQFQEKKLIGFRSFSLAGFTLTEVIVVMSIISFLLVLGVGMYRFQVNKGIDSRRKSDTYQIVIALEAYEKDHECYPTALPACGNESHLLENYIPSIPCDPQTNDNYIYSPDGTEPSCPRWFWLFTDLANEKDSIIEELGCQTGCGPDSGSLLYEYYRSSPNAPEPAK